MKTITLFSRTITLCFFIFTSFFLQLSASDYIPLSLTGFNADAICNSSECNEISKLDGQWNYYSADKKAEGAISQSIVSKFGVEYILNSFDDNNVLTLGSNGVSSGELVLESPQSVKELWVLGMSASGQRDIDVVVNYSDNSFSETHKISFPDWYQTNGTTAAYYGLDRVRDNNSYDGRLNFGLFERVIPVDSTKTVESVDFSYTGSEQTYTSIFAISAFDGERQSKRELYMIANAHFDTQWDWDVQTSIDQYVKNTLVDNFNLFEKYPNYVFNFEGAIKYKFAKEYYPELYEKLKGYVASGRWHISGGSIDANDVMVPSAESIIRNYLLGQEFYKKEFGTKGGNDIMLPDCFGFPYSLPTLGKHCGITGFHTQKLTWGSAYNYDDFPHYGLWKGVDGAEIYAIYKPGSYVNQFHEDLSYNADMKTEIERNKEELGAYKTVRYFGTGDRGGSISEGSAEWMETSVNSQGPVNVSMVTPDEFFDDITSEERDLLPVWDNEMPMREHGVGCYTSQTILKYWNRKGELLADATEKSSTLADWLGGLPYQQDIINENWINILWHQFHDDLTGTSIPKAYVFTNNDLVKAQLDLSKTLNNAAGAVSRKMNTQVEGIPLVVYNPLSIQRDDIVEAKIEVETQPSNISVYEPNGDVVAAQITDYSNGVLSFIFKADVASLGYKTYDLHLNDNASSKVETSLSTTFNTIENGEYLLKLNKNGDVYSILDKKQGNKELLKDPIRLSMQSDQPGYWWSWEISWGDNERAPFAYVDESVELTLVEDGPLRSTMKITRSKNGSDFVQFIRMTSGVNEDRIDFVNEVDWQSQGTLLKVIFPLSASNPLATYDLSIGTIQRGNRTSSLHEVAGHQWADLTNTDESYGVSILNDSKYGWDKYDDNTLRMTLIHTPKTNGDREYQKYQDLGLNKFTYSFYRHMGVWDESTQWQASKLNQPFLAYKTPKHEGDLGNDFEFVSLNTEKVAVKALKKAEASDEMVVRVYELTGENHSNVELTFPADIVSAKEVNGLEEEVGSASIEGNKLTFSITKYQPKSFAVKLADFDGEPLSEPESNKASLDYNIDVMSNDADKRDGNFLSSNLAYPAELLSDEVVADGIKFSIGPRDDDEFNAIKCEGQEIDIPQSTSNKKLYILAASQDVNGTTADFLIDGVSHSLTIEYFAEFVGQWGTVFGESDFKKENIAFTATHRHNISLNKNDSYSYLYMFKYCLSIDADAKKLTLPDNSDIVVFAISTSDNENDDVVAASTVAHLPEYEYIETEDEPEPCAERLDPDKIYASGYTNLSQSPAMANDENAYTKWCDNSGSTKYIIYVFDTPKEICQYNIVHAGIEGDNQISSDFVLQYYFNSAWVTADEVSGNTENKTVKYLTPFVAERVRLVISKPKQDDENIVRIYSFDLFGKEYATGINDIEKQRVEVINHPNPFKDKTTISCNILENVSDIILDVYDITGALIETKSYPARLGINNLEWTNNGHAAGMYFYKLSVNDSHSIYASGKMIIL
ncbi:MAG: glycoside hydrolase family 38 C-terminal domain-containing protein [Paludibacter sp.]|jgi:alpha-mannosidase|nr:glycoside hydrolase family 38 C-terminal domain-containing protein [Paludibacter sp.]